MPDMGPGLGSKSINCTVNPKSKKWQFFVKVAVLLYVLLLKCFADVAYSRF